MSSRRERAYGMPLTLEVFASPVDRTVRASMIHVPLNRQETAW